MLRFIKEALKLPDYYDIVEIPYLDDMYQAYGFMQWLRDELNVNRQRDGRAIQPGSKCAGPV